MEQRSPNGSDRLVRAALDALPHAAVTVFDTHLRLVATRGDALREAGRTPEALEGRLAADALGERWAFYEEAFRAALRGEQSELEVAYPDGSRRHVVRVGPVRDSDGTVIGGVSIATDVTAARVASEALMRAERDLELVLSNTVDPIVRYAPTGEVLWVSPSFEAMFGYRPADVIGTRLRLKAPDVPDSATATVMAAVREHRDTVTVRTLLQPHGRTPIWCDVTTRLVWGDDGRLQFTVAVFRDVTALVVAEGALESALQRYRVLAENSSDAVVELDTGGALTWASPASSTVFGQPVDAVVGRCLEDLVVADDRARLRRSRAATGSGRASPTVDVRLLRPDGRTCWVRFQERAVRDDDGSVTSSVASLADVTESVEARKALADAEEAVRVATHTPGLASSIVDPDGRFLEVNQAWLEVTGRTGADIVGLTLDDVIHPDDRHGESALWRALVSGARDEYRVALRFVRPDGSLRHAEVSRGAVRRSDGSVRFVISHIVDVTEELRAREELEYRAQHDTLTGLPNRLGIVRLLQEQVGALSSGAHLAVLFLDLDDFKTINESLGHEAGDRVLTAVSDRLAESLRPGDHVARFGDDEFLAVVRLTDGDREATRIAARLGAAVDAPLDVLGHTVTPSVCIGIALADAASTPAQLISQADAALAGAKAEGRGRWRFFEEEMHERAVERLTLLDQLRVALDARQFRVHFQPIVSLADGAVVGHEALVRWQHPERGLLLPGTFLSVAEASGLVVGIGEQVLDRVLAVLARHPDLPGRIAVNVSPVQLRRPDGLPDVVTALTAAGVCPHRLALEITETAALSLTDETRRLLVGAAEAGVGLYVDDFGAGYSSVALLRDLPVTGLKLDMSFVRTLTPHPSPPNSLAAGLAGLAAGLGLVSIAEGVETPEQAAILHRQGWQRAQGFWFGRPRPDPVGTLPAARAR